MVCRFAHEYLARLDNYYTYRANEGKVGRHSHFVVSATISAAVFVLV